jgi:predicted DNA-binding protein
MPVGKGKAAVSTVLPEETKDKLQRIADSRKWTLSQTLKELVEEFLDTWMDELGVSKEDTPKKPKR